MNTGSSLGGPSQVAIKFETRDTTSNETRETSKEDILHDSVCDVMRFRIFTEISD